MKLWKWRFPRRGEAKESVAKFAKWKCPDCLLPSRNFAEQGRARSEEQQCVSGKRCCLCYRRGSLCWDMVNNSVSCVLLPLIIMEIEVYVWSMVAKHGHINVIKNHFWSAQSVDCSTPNPMPMKYSQVLWWICHNPNFKYDCSNTTWKEKLK